MVKSPSNNLNERAEQLARLLLWEGRLGRARVMEIYGLSPVRASEWIRSFREQYPLWTTWDSVQKKYVVTEEAFRGWCEINAGEPSRDNGFATYLSQVGIQPASPGETGQPFWNAFPDFSPPSPKTFSMLRRAIEDGHAVELTYRSFGNPDPHRRVIEPHSLVRAGRRWHVRAYSDANKDFRDYSLGRIVKVTPLAQKATSHASDDTSWMSEARVVIVAHPQLTSGQSEVVRFEYFQGTASRTETCRGALVPYLIQDLRAAIDCAREVPPDFQLAVGNVDEVSKWLFPRMGTGQ